MTSRLQGGVTPGPDRSVSASGPMTDGTPVVVGPRGADARPALQALSRLVATSGPVAAAADVDLGDGFVSGRVEGGAGDRRDAVLAVLANPGFAGRRPDRRTVLTALFGPDATRPLGAAAQAAVDAGRWAVLRYAVAVSDLLGPEQLVEILALPDPAAGDPFPDGLPSVAGSHLARVLAGIPRPRRLVLLSDLWTRAGAELTVRRRLERLRATQGRADRIGDVRRRREQWDDDELTAWLPNPRMTVLDAARWSPPEPYWRARLAQKMNDVLAATVLARLVVTMVDHGLDEALARHRHELEAVVPPPARQTVRQPGLPALPGTYVVQILRRSGSPADAGTAQYIGQRLARVHDYGHAVLWDATEAITDIVVDRDHPPAATRALRAWAGGGMAEWRGRVGYFAPERLSTWEQEPRDDIPALATRLGDRPPAEVETVGDLLWLGELGDALARLHGRTAADVEFQPFTPLIDPEPYVPEEPLVPATHSVALAAAGAAQLTDLGGVVPPRVRTWPELVAGLLGSAGIAAAMTGEFVVPEAIGATHGTALPGTAARIEVARTGGQLAAWAAYMGNCIAGGYYQDEATAGRSVLVALRAADDRLLANAELRPAGDGWRIREMKARFNEDPDPVLHRRLAAWVNGLGRPEPVAAEIEPPVNVRAATRRPAAAARVLKEASIELNERAAEEWEAFGAPLARLLDRPLVALRRATPAGLLELVRAVLPELRPLWTASAERPLARAIATLPEAARARFAPLTVDEPLPGALRGPARRPFTGSARTADVVSLRVRAALGRLLRADDPDLAAAVRAHPDPGILRAAALAATTWSTGTAVAAPERVTVPGFPRTSLNDDSWLAAWPGAVELGAEPAVFWPRIAAHGLLLPASWTAGHFEALWARAHDRAQVSPGPGAGAGSRR